jgi:hypothetical protein
MKYSHISSIGDIHDRGVHSQNTLFRLFFHPG